MANMTLRGTATTWFNTRLFHINGKQMKFYLDGFDQPTIYKISKIVEAYGGQFAELGKDVIIFSEPNYSTRTYDNVFDSKYLYDCIMSNKTLELGKYTLSCVSQRSINNNLINKTGEITELNNNVTHRNGVDVKLKVNSEANKLHEQFDDKNIESRRRKIKVGCSNCNVIWPNFAVFELSESDVEESNQSPEKRRRSSYSFGCARTNGLARKQQLQPEYSNSPVEKKEELSGKNDLETLNSARTRKFRVASTPEKLYETTGKGRYNYVTSIEIKSSSETISSDALINYINDNNKFAGEKIQGNLT